MKTAHQKEMSSLLHKVNILRNKITYYGINDYTKMGRLFGVESEQFANINELEKYLSSLLEAPLLKDIDEVEMRSIKKFLRTQITRLNKYKDLILSDMVKEEESIHLKAIVNAETGLPITTTKLSTTHINLVSGFDSIQHSLAATVNKINESFIADIQTKESRIELATAILKVGLGVVGTAAVADVIAQSMRNLNPSTIAELTGLSGNIPPSHEIETLLVSVLAAETINTTTDIMLIHASKVVMSASSRISSDFQDEVTRFLSLIKARSCSVLTKAVEELGQVTMNSEEWDLEIDRANRSKLSTCNPNHLEFLVSEVRREMQQKTLKKRERAAEASYASLSPAIKKVIEFAAIDDGPEFEKKYTEKMEPITHYFQIFFIASVLSREYHRKAALAHGYKPAVGIQKYEGFEPMVRDKQIKHFPASIKNSPNLLMLFEPKVLMGKIRLNTQMHKGGKKLREFLTTEIVAIKDNMEAYGFKKPVKPGAKTGAMRHKGLIEDMLRSYAVITLFMEEASCLQGPYSSIPIFKQDKHIVSILKMMMECNVFFATHPDNKKMPLVTPLCVYNRDPHLMDLIKLRPGVKASLAKLMTTENFILKCVTDPNIKDLSKDKNRLLSTLDELIKLLESTVPEVSSFLIFEVRKQAEHYIECQCVRLSISKHMAQCVTSANDILLHLPKIKSYLTTETDDNSIKSLLEKLIKNPEKITSLELGQIDHALKILVQLFDSKMHIEPNKQILNACNDFLQLQKDKIMLEDLENTQQNILGVGFLIKPSAFPFLITEYDKSSRFFHRLESDDKLSDSDSNESHLSSPLLAQLSQK